MPQKKFSIGSWDDEAADPSSGGGWFDDVLPKGTYQAAIRTMKITKIKGKEEERIYGVAEVVSGEYKGLGAGYGVNVTEQGWPYVVQLLNAIGTTAAAFRKGAVIDGEEPPNITKIGTVKVTGENLVTITTTTRKWDGEDRADVRSFAPASDEDEGDDDGVDADEVDPEDVDSDEEEQAEEGAEDEGDADDEAWTEESLAEEDQKELIRILIEDFEGKKPVGKAGSAALTKKLIAAILEAQEAAAGEEAEESDAEADESDEADSEEEAEEEESEEDGDSEDEEYTADDLKKFSLAELKTLAREDFELKTFKSDTEAKLIDRILKKQAEPPF